MPMKGNILVLCHSNMHRSPSVAGSIRNPPCGDSYEARGAGLHAGKGQRVPKPLQRAFQAVSRGSLESHKPRPVETSGILWADKITIMEPEGKNGLLQMPGSLHLSGKPRYGQVASKITPLAQTGGKAAVDGPHHYSPGTAGYGKAVLNPACLAAALPETWEARRPWGGGEKPKGREPDGAGSAAGPSGAWPLPPPHTIPHSVHLGMIYAFGAGQRKPPVEAGPDGHNRRPVLPPAAAGSRKPGQTPAAEAGRHGARLFNHQMVHVVHACPVPRLVAGGGMG